MFRKNSSKKFIASAVTTSLVVSAFAPTISFANETQVQILKDMKENDFGYKEVAALKVAGYIDGFPDGTFRPHQLLKREEATKLLISALHKSGDGTIPNFSDVKKDSIWMPFVDAAVDHEIMLGHKNGKFGFGDHLTREQMASVLVRAFELKPTSEKVDFTDLSNSSPSHKQDIMTLAQNGITLGFKDGTFKPKEKISRVDFTVFLYRALEEIKKVDQPVTGGGGGSVIVPPVTPVNNEIDLNGPYTVEDGHVYTGNHTILFGNNTHGSAAVFKASSPGNEVVFNGDLTVKGNGYINLENVIVNGKLTLNPSDLGGVKLSNVTATSIVVSSGAMNTTTFSDVTAESIKVTDSNGGRIIMDGANYVDKFELAPTKSATAPEFKLGGTFTAPIELTSDLILTTDTENILSAESIELKSANAGSEIKLDGNLENVSHIKVSSPVVLNVSSSASVSSVDIATNSVTIKGDLSKSNIVVTQSATVTLAGDSQIGTVDIDESVESVNITGDLSGSTDTLQVSSAAKVSITPEEAIALEFYNKAVASANALIVTYLETAFSLESRNTVKTIQSLIETAKLFGGDKYNETEITKLSEFTTKATEEKAMIELLKAVDTAVQALPSAPVRKDEAFIAQLDALLKATTSNLNAIQESNTEIATWEKHQLLSVESLSRLERAVQHSANTKAEWHTTVTAIEAILEAGVFAENATEIKSLYSRYLKYKLTGDAEFQVKVTSFIEELNQFTKFEAQVAEFLALKNNIPVLTRDNTKEYQEKAELFFVYHGKKESELGNEWTLRVKEYVDEIVATYNISHIYDYERVVDAFIESDYENEEKYLEYVKVMNAFEVLISRVTYSGIENDVYRELEAKFDNYLVTRFNVYIPSEINELKVLHMPTEDGLGLSISWESSHPNIISTDGQVNLENMNDGIEEVTLTATVTKGNASHTIAYTVNVVQDSEEISEVYVHIGDFYGWTEYGRQLNDSSVNLTLNLLEIKKTAPDVVTAKAILKIGENEISQDFEMYEDENYSYVSFNDILSYWSLSGDQHANISIVIYDADGKEVKTYNYSDKVIVDLRPAIEAQLKEDYLKSTFSAENIKKYLYNPYSLTTFQLNYVLTEIQKLSIDEVTLVKLNTLTEDLKTLVDPLEIQVGVPFQFEEHESGFGESGKVKNVHTTGEGISVEKDENGLFSVSVIEGAKGDVVVTLETGNSFTVPVMGIEAKSTLEIFNDVISRIQTNNHFVWDYFLLLIHHADNMEDELSIPESVGQYILSLSNYDGLDKFTDISQIQMVINQLDREIIPLRALQQFIEDFEATELEKGIKIDINKMLEESPFKDSLTNPEVKLEYTVQENSDYVTYENGVIEISPEYDDSALVINVQFELVSGDMMYARLEGRLGSYQLPPNHLTYFESAKALSYWDNLTISSTGTGKAYFIPVSGEESIQVNDETTAINLAEKIVEVKQGDNKVSMENLTGGNYKVLIFNKGLKSTQYVYLFTEGTLSNSEIKLKQENQMISFGSLFVNPLLEMEFDFGKLGTIATKEIEKSDIEIKLSLQEGINFETAQSITLTEDDFTLENGVLKVKDLKVKFEGIHHELVDPYYDFHILINKNNEVMWNMNGEKVQAIKRTEVTLNDSINRNHTSERYIQLRTIPAE